MAEESIDAINQPVVSAPGGHGHGHGHRKKKPVALLFVKPPPTPFAVKPIGAFWFFLAANLLAALFAPVQDCDETFNYWEPTHYISHGYGLQTWEYSPEYAIRSWLYIMLHAIPGNLRRLMPFPSKVGEFYYIRYTLAFVCAICQTTLFRVINNTINPRIALFFMMAMIFSPGMFHASASFLPSSFAMYTTMLGMANFMNWRGGLKTWIGICWFSVGAIIGWPFSFALSFPFLFEEILFASMSNKNALIEAIGRLFKGAVSGLVVLAFEFLISTFFYRSAEVVPLNIVLYNVFAGEGRGPNIYGTEPWHFYIRNLLLNFNLWFILAMLTFPLFILQKLFSSSGEGMQTGLRSLIFMSPFYLWLGIFSVQPHKEERFMYPAYPSLALNAAMSLHICLAAFGTTNPSNVLSKIPSKLKLLVVTLILVTSVDIGLARIYGIYTGYGAPLRIYEPLQNGTIGSQGDTVCFGKEWYRFPSSYFLPNEMKAKFIKSEFNGLLPGQFAEAKTGSGFWSGTWLLPGGMNDRNEEDPGKYIDARKCSFLIDTYYPGSEASKLEPHYVLDNEHWDEVTCQPFLDAGKTHVLARTIWLPEFLIPDRFKRRWGNHCLLKRKTTM